MVVNIVDKPFSGVADASGLSTDANNDVGFQVFHAQKVVCLSTGGEQCFPLLIVNSRNGT